MKTLYESLLDDFDTLEANADPRKTIEEFLDHNFSGTWHISDKPNKDGYYEVSSNFSIHGIPNRVPSLTNGLFIWTKVKGSFSCRSCINLTSLEGGPKVTQDIFDCSYCPKLKSLKGAPEISGKCFTCKCCGERFSIEEVKKYTKSKKIINI